MTRLRNYMLLSGLAVVTLLVVAVSAERPSETPSAAATTLAIEVSMKSGPFTVPAAGPGREVSAHIPVPSVDSAKARPDQVTAVRLMPRIVNDKVEVKVYALYGDVSNIASCEDWGRLKASFVGEYSASGGEEFAVKELNDMGVSFGEKPLTVHIVPMKVAPRPQTEIAPIVAESCGCGGCGALSCCPENGKCLRCGTCGSVCCTLKP